MKFLKKIKNWVRSHKRCPHCGQQLGPPGSYHVCS